MSWIYYAVLTLVVLSAFSLVFIRAGESDAETERNKDVERRLKRLELEQQLREEGRYRIEAMTDVRGQPYRWRLISRYVTNDYLDDTFKIEISTRDFCKHEEAVEALQNCINQKSTGSGWIG